MFESGGFLRKPNPKSIDQTTAILPVQFHSVWFEQERTALLRDLNVTVTTGSKTVIMGPNGAGKSLLLRLLQGLIRPTRGQIDWACKTISTRTAPPVSLVLQRPVLLRRSVEGNLSHALKTFRVPTILRKELTDELLTMSSLECRRRQPARSLSGGEQQRLATVRAMAGNPQLLLLDEPTANLDPQATHAIERLIERAHSNGTKIVLVTHDIGQAKRMADDIYFMAQGRITEVADANRFFRDPQSSEAQAYLDGQLLM